MNSEPNIIKGEAGAAPPAGLDLRFFYYVVFRHKWKIAFLFAAGLSAAVAVCLVKGPVYQSEAKLLVRYVLENEGRSLSPTAMDSQLKSPDPGGSSIINGEMEMLGSFDLAQQVADSVGAERILGEAGGETNRIRAALVIQRNLHTEAPGKSSVIRVVFQHPDAELVQPVLSKLITNYLDRHFKLHLAPGVFNDFLSNRTVALGNELKETEDRLRELKQSIGVVSVEDTKKAYAERMSKTGAELFSAMAELAEQKAMLEEPGKVAPLNTNSSAAATVAEEKVPPHKVDEYNALSARVESFLKKENDYLPSGYAETSDFVKGVRKSIAELEQKKRRLVEEYPQLTRLNLPTASGGTQGGPGVAMTDPLLEASKKIRALEAKIKVLNEQLDKMRAEAAKVDAAEPEITQLERQRVLLNTNYHYYQVSWEQSRVVENLGAGRFSNIGVVQEPSPPFRENKKTLKLAAVALAFGVFGGIALGFIIELVLDHSVRRPEEIRTKLRLPLFLTIPYLSRNGHAPRLGPGREVYLPAERGWPNQQSGAAPGAEQTRASGKAGGGQIAPWETRRGLGAYYEALRDRLVTYFEVNNMAHKPKLVAVTSCSRGAGVTSTAAGLAAALSETGAGNVLLCDMNLEQGAAHPFYKGKVACGLSDALESGKRDPALIGQNLYLASLNGTTEKLPRVLPKRFTNLVPKLKMSDYDYIIFDMPAISQTSITPRVAAFMDLVLLVIESEKTNCYVVEQAESMLAESQVSAKAVLNKYRRYVPQWLQQEL